MAFMALRLSKNETDDLMRKESAVAATRIKVEVREQSKKLSQHILNSRLERKTNLVEEVSSQLLVRHYQSTSAELLHLRTEIQKSVEAIGTAHKAASSEPDYEAIRAAQEEKFRKVARVRVKHAAKKEEEIKIESEAKQTRIPCIRREVRSLEDLRAAHLVQKFRENEQAEPKRSITPKADPVLVFDQKNLHQYNTYRRRNLVSKVRETQNAQQMADEASMELKREERLKDIKENRKKAQERGKKALKSQSVRKQYLEIMERLNHMELEPGWDICEEELERPELQKDSYPSVPPTALLPHSLTQSQARVEEAEQSCNEDQEKTKSEPQIDGDSEHSSLIFTRPLIDDIRPRKKVIDDLYLNHVKSMLEDIAGQRKYLEEEFDQIPREVMSCLDRDMKYSRPARKQEVTRPENAPEAGSNMKSRYGPESGDVDELDESHFQQTCEQIRTGGKYDGSMELKWKIDFKPDLNPPEFSTSREILGPKKESKRQEAFQNVHDSVAKRKLNVRRSDSISFIRSNSSTGSTSYLDLPQSLTRFRKIPDLSGSGSTQYMNLPDKLSVPKVTQISDFTKGELADAIRQVLAERS